MGKIGYGYGSEWHLLRYFGYHREKLSFKTLQVTGGNSIKWLDLNFSKRNAPLLDDREFKGLEFIQDENVQERWELFWPQTGNVQNWDAVGTIHYDGYEEWLLVEAKGHIGEIRSDCGASSPESRQKIRAAMEKTSRSFTKQAMPVENWLNKILSIRQPVGGFTFSNERVPSAHQSPTAVHIFLCGKSERRRMPPGRRGLVLINK